MGRPPVAFGVWPDMIQAAKGAGRLASALGCSSRQLYRVSSGLSSALSGPRAELARDFAESHGISARLYVAPRVRGFCLLSMAHGWFLIPNAPGGWAHRFPASRLPGENWSVLPGLELDFASSWGCLSAGPRPE